MLYDYDKSDPLSILNYARRFKNKSFHNLLSDYENNRQKADKYENDVLNLSIEDTDKPYGISNEAKGQVGNLLEKYGFGYEPNSNQEADFPLAQVELKQTCIDIRKNGSYAAGERLSITNISYKEPVEDDFYHSHVWNKIKLILLVHYLRDKKIERLDNIIKFINLFTPPEEDLKIIVDDYQKIIEKIKNGEAHELSEGDTLYLGACTKGATAQKSIQPQFYGGIPAKKRNFCLKRSYMDYVLTEYILKNKVPFLLPGETEYRYCSDLSSYLDKNKKSQNLDASSIIQNLEEIDGISFEDFILNKINKNIGKSDLEIYDIFSCKFKKDCKNFHSRLAFKMIGVESNQATEFIKASIVVKSIRIQENNKIKESMSFPYFKFLEIVNQEWEESELFNTLSETKFLFVIFREDKNCYRLEKAIFWNMPYRILDNEIKNCWLKTKACISDGVQFIINTQEKTTVNNNLPGMTDNGIIHVRPHTAHAAYQLNNGYRAGNIEKDGDILPNGEIMTKQSFWLNNSYLLHILGIEK